MRFVLFFTIVGVVSAAIHRYLWIRLVRDPAWPEPWRSRATWALVTLGTSTLLAMILDRPLPRAAAAPLTWTGMVWLGLMFYLFVLLLLHEPVRLLAGASAPFARNAAAVVVAAAATICAYGAIVVARGPRIVQTRVAIR